MRVKKEVQLAADPVFLLREERIDSENITKIKGRGIKKIKTLLICLRSWPDFEEKVKDIAQGCGDFLSSSAEWKIKLLPMHYPEDLVVARKFQSYVPAAEILTFETIGERKKILKLFLTTDMVLGMRLHSLIFSVFGAIPCIAIAYDPKIKSFVKENNIPLWNDEKCSGEELTQLLLNEEKNSEVRKNELREKREINISRAGLPVAYLKEIIKGEKFYAGNK